MSLLTSISSIILSAGDSSRMGKHKALLRFGNQKQTFLEKITQEYENAGTDQTIVVVNKRLYEQIDYENPVLPGNVRIVINRHPSLGRFYSLQTGLRYVEKGSWVFFQNVDNPFVNKEILLKMIDNRDLARVLIPVYSGIAGHPVLINPEVSDTLILHKNVKVRIDHFLRDFSVAMIGTDNKGILANINTSLDYREEFKVETDHLPRKH